MFRCIGSRLEFYVLCLVFLALEGTAHSKAWQVADVYRMPPDKLETRWYTYENQNGEKGAGGQANFGRKGAPAVWVQPGDTLVLADIHGSGTIRRIWMALRPEEKFLRGVKIRMYWENSPTPAVQAPLGDFFGHGFGKGAVFENIYFASPEGRSLNCYVPMPFKEAARIEVVNEADTPQLFYYEVDATVGDKHGDDMLYFHSYWRRENKTEMRKDMVILPEIQGRGRFLGCYLGARINPKCDWWWGEGEVKIYLDGDTQFPTLCGTGTEDYAGTGWGQGVYDNAFWGNPYKKLKSPDVPGSCDAYGFYRFHVPDPVFFHENIRVTIQAMGGGSYAQILDAMKKHPDLKIMKAGKGGEYYTKEELAADPGRAEPSERSDDWFATAYWFMDRPEDGLPAISGYAERMADLPEGAVWPTRATSEIR